MRRSAIVLLPILVACSCSSSKGGNADATPPRLLSAVFVGTGTSPAPGETLRLFFDEAVALVSGALVTDADLSLSAGATLGAVTAAPSQLDSRTVVVVLGAGVNLTPGSTTVALGPGNDAVLDGAGNLGRDGVGVIVTKGDGDVPVIARLSASEVDGSLNGTGTAGGTLQVPTTGFTIDLTYGDLTSNVDPARNTVSASVAVTVGGQSVPAGTNLLSHLVANVANATTASYQLPNSVVFPAGDVVLSALVADTTGMVSAASTFAMRTVTANSGLRPFETDVNPNQVWFLDTARDLEAYTLTPSGGTTFDVVVVPGANGRADLLDALTLIGLQGPDAGVNATVVAQLRTVLQLELLTLFAGANVTFTFDSPGTFGSSPSVAYSSFPFSQICIAGTATQAGVLGLALFDANNDSQNNDCLDNFQNSRLGVFVVTVMDNINGLGGPSTSLFRQTYDPFRSEIAGGVPIGADAQDAARLAGTVTGARQTQIANAIARLARFIAVVVAHETGHSMGLVKNGAMPTGLYGGDPTNFPGSNDQHIRMPTTVFPLGSVNVMSPTLNFELAMSSSTAFNSLNRAYLRERALYNR